LLDVSLNNVWSSNTASLKPLELHLKNDGNLVLSELQGSNILWQSFDSPTDTLLPGQPRVKESNKRVQPRDWKRWRRCCIQRHIIRWKTCCNAPVAILLFLVDFNMFGVFFYMKMLNYVNISVLLFDIYFII